VASLVLAAPLVSSGCGPPQPQAPITQANRVASALAGISAACGQSYQQHAFAAHPQGLSVLETTASARATELTHVYRQNPNWIYQGATLRQIVALTIHYLGECGLPAAASSLERETR
jgi:hypothetical protein